MKRREFLKSSVVGTSAAVALAAPALAQSEPLIRWRLVSSYPRSIDVLYGCAEVMAKNRRRSDRQTSSRSRFWQPVRWCLHFRCLIAVSNQTVEMCHTAAYYFTGKNTGFAFATHVPFGLNTRQQNAWAYHGEGKALLADFFRNFNVVGLPAGNTGAQMGGWFRKEINSIADLKGLKFRISGLGGNIVSKLGAVPQQIGGGDIYPALERGALDAAEFNGPYDDEKLGFYKVAPYYYYPGWWDGSAMLHFFIGSAAYDKLPNSYKAALTSAAALANVDCVARYDIINPPALKRVVAQGAKLRAFSNDLIDGAHKAAMELYDDMAGKNPDFRKFYDSMRKFQAESGNWYLASEYSYDTAMLRTLKR